MGCLNNIPLAISYRSDRDNLVPDFYIPCMKNAILYRRAVGYFTSYGLAYAAAGIAHLIEAGGRIQLAASPQLTEEDIEAINAGYASEKDVLVQSVKRTFVEIENLLVKDRLAALAWMIHSGSLEVKLAVRLNPLGNPSNGIYHEKIGLFSDEKGNCVAFSGSANETASGLLDNFEAIDVFCSWDDPQHRVQGKIDTFERLWSNNTAGLKVLDFTAVSADILRPYKPEYAPAPNADTSWGEHPDNKYSANPVGPVLPGWLELREYQKQAINNWLKNGGMGSLKMATGSGKTIIALSALTHLYHQGHLKAAVVLCPYKHLVDQWAEEARKFNYNPLIVHTSRHHWLEQLNHKLRMLGAAQKEPLLVITTNSSFAQDLFQSKLQYFPHQTVLVADEAHNLGAKQLRTKLPENIKFRLALSATPERWFDDEGTSALFDYFGAVLEPEFSLKDALEKGALAQYRYHPILVELTDAEREEYLNLSDKIALSFNIDGSEETNTYLETLLIKRARLLASAENKLYELKELMRDRTESNNLSLLGLASYGRETNRMHIISSKVEHKAVLEPLEFLAKHGFQITLLPVNNDGAVNPADVAEALRPDTLLVSVMHVNNETGVIQPIEEIAQLLESHAAFFHVDAAQSYGKLIKPLCNRRIDLISASAHKMFGPKGIGALIMRRRDYDLPPIQPLVFGGGQERGFRSGTLPVPLIAGFGEASALAKRDHIRRAEYCAQQQSAALEALSGVDYELNGALDKLIPHTLNISITGVDSEATMLCLKGIAELSNGSACTSASYTPSHVLQAMGYDEERIQSAIRISWSHLTQDIPWGEIAECIKRVQG